MITTVEKFTPMLGKVFVTNMDEGMHRTAGGIIITDDNVKETGIRPRWSQVSLIGEGVTDIAVGDWILLPHGRWTNRLKFEISGERVDLWMIDPEDILMVSDENPSHERYTI